jgi:hypothetical protein
VKELLSGTPVHPRPWTCIVGDACHILGFHGVYLVLGVVLSGYMHLGRDGLL